MDLLEYQAKALFREMAIPVLPSQRIDYPADLKGLKIPYPVVLKSQVRAGGRGRAGGIKFVENTIDAVAAAQTIFNLPIMDEYPEVLLAEAKYDADQELYLAVLLDPVARRPVLLGSQQGGINVEAAMEQMQQVVVDECFSPFYARRLALKMGLQGELIQSVSAIVEQMYQLFVQKDLDLVEINPLGISRTGEVMALDGKVSANDAALGRHPGLAALVKRQGSAGKAEEKRKEEKGLGLRSKASRPHPSVSPTSTEERLQVASGINFVEMEGNIGVVCNGAGLAMATLDALLQAKGKPANFLSLGAADYSEVAQGLCDRLEKGLDLATQDKSVKVVLVNILGSLTASEDMAATIAAYLERKARASRTPQVVLRLGGSNLDVTKERLAGLPVQLVETLDEAVAHAVSLAK